jgi:hypothetical protein
LFYIASSHILMIEIFINALVHLQADLSFLVTSDSECCKEQHPFVNDCCVRFKIIK